MNQYQCVDEPAEALVLNMHGLQDIYTILEAAVVQQAPIAAPVSTLF